MRIPLSRRRLCLVLFLVYASYLGMKRESLLLPVADHVSVLLEGRTLKGIPAHQLESFLRLSQREQEALEARPELTGDVKGATAREAERARLRRQRAVFQQERWWLEWESSPLSALWDGARVSWVYLLGLLLVWGAVRREVTRDQDDRPEGRPRQGPSAGSVQGPAEGEVLRVPTEDEIREILHSEQGAAPPPSSHADSQETLAAPSRRKPF